MRIRLPVRLFISYAAVAVIGAAVTYLTVRLLAPALFDHDMAMMGGTTWVRARAGSTVRPGACARRSCPR